MRSPLTVVYDACVLYPAPLRDFLMRLALTDLFRARWSDQIHDEWIRNVLRQRPELRKADLERTRQLMNAHVRDCLVTGFETWIPSVVLPDPDDRHVAAAAIHCQADLIITFNLRDFPREQLARFNLAPCHPDEFILQLLTQAPQRVLEAAAAHRQSLRKPPRSADEYLNTLAKQGLERSVALLRQWRAVL